MTLISLWAIASQAKGTAGIIVHRRTVMRNMFFAVFVLTAAATMCVAETGELVLRAVDIDTGKPIAGVSFAIENGHDEDWAVEVGKADATGVLQLQARKRRGYYYMVWRKPKEYKVVGFDDAYIDIVPGGTVSYDFKLRKRGSTEGFPPIVPVPSGHERRVPAPSQLENNAYLASTVEDMPGFEGKRVTFWFYADKQGKAAPELLDQAERIFLSGRRVAAAVRDELEYFQKAVPKDSGDIDKMGDILIQLGPVRDNTREPIHWRFWCRLPGGIRLSEYGYRVGFTDLDAWDLYVDAFMQVPYCLQPRP